MRTGGRYLRFYEFPVKVWMGGQLSARWSDALEDALLEIGQVVPMERVFVENQATLVIYVMSPDEYQRWSGCPGDLTSGCARIVDFGDIAGGDTYHRIYGQVWMNKAARNPHGTLLHEMLHAVGVMVHSPDKNDIMYPFETDAVRMSERDLNTLRRLYANPSYAD
jgi:predicted Zn-dependent protease